MTNEVMAGSSEAILLTKLLKSVIFIVESLSAIGSDGASPCSPLCPSLCLGLALLC